MDMVDTKFVYPILFAGLVLFVIWIVLYNFTSIEFTNLYGELIAVGGLVIILGIIFYRQWYVLLKN